MILACELKMFNAIFDACDTKLMVIKSTLSWAPLFISIGIITDSKSRLPIHH